MGEAKKKKIKNPDELANTLKLILTVIAAALTAFVYRRSAGVLSMTPIAFIICGISAFIGLKPILKFTIFGLTVFAFNTIEQSDMKVTLTYTVLCLAACIIFQFAVKLSKKRKAAGICLFCLGAIACLCTSLLLIGNPIKAMTAKNALEDYSNKKYRQTENAALGEFLFSDIYYDSQSKTYCIDANSNLFPTEFGILSFDGKRVHDSFLGIMEEKLTEPYVLDMTSLLRKYFPDDNFSVSCDDITSLPNQNVLTSAEGELNGNLVFEIHLGGVQTADGMLEKVEQYVKIIDDSQVKYAKIIFKSGTSQWVRRSVTIDSRRIDGFDSLRLERVPAETSNRFNRFISAPISIK